VQRAHEQSDSRALVPPGRWNRTTAKRGFQLSAGRIRPAKEAVPYTSAALRQDLDRVRSAWEDCQANRDRNAIYG
jgi:hypothetical protein